MWGQLRRIPSIPGYLVFRTLCLCSGMYGGTTREDPEYPGILSIPDTVSVRWYVWGDNSGGSRVSRDSQDIPGSPVATHDTYGEEAETWVIGKTIVVIHRQMLEVVANGNLILALP